MRKLLNLFVIFSLSVPSFGQKITGNWEGKIVAGGTTIPIVFHFYSDSTGRILGKWDSPSQNALDLPCGEVRATGDSLVVLLPVISGSYSGNFAGADSITGEWDQKGIRMPLNLARQSGGGSYTLPKRPQTPHPPFPYISDSVVYRNSDSTIRYGATFTRPKGQPGDQYPVVLMITGSGKQDRDETIFDHHPFAVIADYLARRGIAALRVDDRGMGQTTGDFDTSSSLDFAGDVEAGIRYLLSRSDVDPAHIGLLGHSEGGLIAPMVASGDPRVAFLVLLAAPGIPGMDVINFQNGVALKNAGLPDSVVQKFLVLHDALVNAAVSATGPGPFREQVPGIYQSWKKDQSAGTLKDLIHGSDESVIKNLQAKYYVFHSKWWRFFLFHDPSGDLEKLDIPVLALNGSRDIQVDPQVNLDAIRAALKKSRSKNYKTIELPGLNHLFQHCTTCTLDEYGKLEETIAPEVLRTVSDWISSVVK